MFDTTQPAHIALRSIISERTNRLVAWIGAGLSQPAGIPSWSGLRDRLCEALRIKIARMEIEEKEKTNLLAKLEIAQTESDYWTAFSILRSALGATSFREEIRSALAPSATCRIPQGYELLWRLPVDGVISLNLDRLASRAFSSVMSGKELIQFNGKQTHNYVHILKGSRYFVANLHGIHEDESSWVLTRDDLKNLLDSDSYKEFLRSIFMSRTVVFMGISADDIAVSGQLDYLRHLDIDFGCHFWITQRADANTDAWAEAARIRLIAYRGENNDHSEFNEFLEDLKGFIPSDTEAPPVQVCGGVGDVGSSTADTEISNDANAETLRRSLNVKALEILGSKTKESLSEYKHFCKTNAALIHRAWYVSTEPPDNVLLGYELKHEIAEGAFGRVFEAKTRLGESVALKLLHGHVMRKSEMLESFRRGVRSMQILSRHNVQGMVPYRDAGEIPAFAVMELIHGPNLRTAVESQNLNGWPDILRVSHTLATIIRSAHLLPERVLHRDIRPANIMLKGFWEDPANYEVLVLDFDLSWHMGSLEASVVAGEAVHGFLAPEQIERNPSVSTRNSAVDSFGLGMTLFYLVSRRAPRHMEHVHRDWQQTLANLADEQPCLEWSSLPKRFCRLISCATLNEQARRWDMSQIEGELARLTEAQLAPNSVRSAELWAEETCARSSRLLRGNLTYEWNPDRCCGSMDLLSGVLLNFSGNESRRDVEISLEWTNRGQYKYQNVRKYLTPAMQKAKDALNKYGWTVRANPEFRSDHVHFSVCMTVEDLRKKHVVACQGVEHAAREFDFS